MKSLTNVTFIDRTTYDSIMSSKQDGSVLDRLMNLHNGTDSTYSEVTKGLFTYCNDFLSRVLLRGHYSYHYNALSCTGTVRESYQDASINKYVKELFQNEYVLNKPECEKYYEIQILPDGLLLVIFERGFVYYLAEFKVNLQKFILDCLCAYFGYGMFSSSVNSENIVAGINSASVMDHNNSGVLLTLMKYYISLLENNNSYIYFKSMV